MGLVYASPGAAAAAVALALGMAGLLAWSGRFFSYFPEGWYVDVTPARLVTALALALLFGLLVPMQVYALRKARGTAGSAAGTGAGLVLGMTSISCCTPLLAPALLAFAGFTGTSIAAFNVAAYRYATPLQLLAVVLMLAALLIVSHTITAACRIGDRA